MKNVFKKILINCLNILCAFFPKRNDIIFESNPDFACNSNEVYKYISNDTSFCNYRFVWRVINGPYFIYIDKRTFIVPKNPKKIRDKIKAYFIINRARLNISCVDPYPKYKTNRKQLNIYLSHASCLKGMLKDGKPMFNISSDFIISQATFFNELIVKAYNYNPEKIVVTGIPRNDQFYSDIHNMDNIYTDYFNFKKRIAWVPTFRVSASNRIDCSFDFPFGVPILYTDYDFEILNNALKENDCLLIIKPHPACKLDVIIEKNFSNIRFLQNIKMLEGNIQTNEFLNQTDAMITDYSGIYYDYLLTNKPIGITLDDFDVYKKEHGFMFDNPLNILKGRYIYNLNEFIDFIRELANGIDNEKEAREKIKKMTNDFDDGNSTNRVVSFIKKELGIDA